MAAYEHRTSAPGALRWTARVMSAFLAACFIAVLIVRGTVPAFFFAAVPAALVVAWHWLCRGYVEVRDTGDCLFLTQGPLSFCRLFIRYGDIESFERTRAGLGPFLVGAFVPGGGRGMPAVRITLSPGSRAMGLRHLTIATDDPGGLVDLLRGKTQVSGGPTVGQEAPGRSS